MSKGSTRDLAEFLERKADDYLRSVIHYRDHDYSIVYLRDDVAEQYSEEEIEERRIPISRATSRRRIHRQRLSIQYPESGR